MGGLCLRGLPRLQRSYAGCGRLQVRDLVWDASCTKAVQMEVQYEALHKGQFRDSMGRVYGGKITLICGMACMSSLSPSAAWREVLPNPTILFPRTALTGPHTASVAVDGRKLIGSKNTPRQYVYAPLVCWRSYHWPLTNS